MDPRQQPSPLNALNEWYTDWTLQTPMVTRYSVSVIGFGYLWSWFFSVSAFSVIPYYTVFKFEIYRFLLAPFFVDSIFSLLFIAVTLSSMGSRLEYKHGSVHLTFLLGVLSLASNLVFILAAFLLATFGHYEALFLQAHGFLPTLLGIITIECLESPEGHRRLFFLPPIPTKYYPVALFGLFTLFGGFDVSLAVSMAVGWLFQKGYLDFLKPTSATVQRWEESCLVQFTTRTGYVSGSAAGSGVFQAMRGGDDSGSATSSTGGSPFVGMFPSVQGMSNDVEAGGADDSGGRFAGGGQVLGGDGPASAPMDPSEARAARLNAISARQTPGSS